MPRLADMDLDDVEQIEDEELYQAWFTDVWRRHDGLPPLGAAYLPESAVINLGDLKTQPVDWLWPRWIPRHALTILGGTAGAGKSTVLASIIASLTAGTPLPDGAESRPANVLLITREEAPHTAIAPRLALHGADLDRVFVHATERAAEEEHTTLSFLFHRAELETLVEVRQIGLIVIDPIDWYIQRLHATLRANPLDVMSHLVRMAERTGIALVGVIGTDGTRTATSRSAMLARPEIASVARSIIALAELPSHHQPPDASTGGTRRILQVVKSNFTIPPPPLEFRRPLDGPIAWQGDADVDIEHCLQPASVPQTAPELANAIAFLRATLADGPAPCQPLYDLAADQGIAERTLRRARATIGIATNRDDEGHYTWTLPQPT